MRVDQQGSFEVVQRFLEGAVRFLDKRDVEQHIDLVDELLSLVSLVESAIEALQTLSLSLFLL